jgi:peptide/nickel transport system ATP-binding protein
MSNVIELKRVNVTFTKRSGLLKERRFHVLKNIDFSIGEGEIVAVVGESGCGKTTLGRIVTGLLKPSTGDILFEGKSIQGFLNTDFAQFRKSVQFIQQDSYSALNPVRTIYQSMQAPIATHYKKMTHLQIDDRIEELMGLVGLTPAEQFLTKYPHQLSGGQRQRVLMARALSLGPKLIVADEPVSMIDVSLRLSILNLMGELNRKFKIAFLYITHDLATAKYIANNQRIAVMYLGEIVEVGNINSILQNARHPYTQALLSAVPVPDPEIATLRGEIPIKGMNLASLEHRTLGCPFYERCPYGETDCENNPVPVVRVDRVEIRCHHEKKVPKWKNPQ